MLFQVARVVGDSGCLLLLQQLHGLVALGLLPLEVSEGFLALVELFYLFLLLQAVLNFRQLVEILSCQFFEFLFVDLES